MKESGVSWVVGVVLVIIAAVAGGSVFNPRLVLNTESDWESLSPDLREAGREGYLSAPAQIVLNLPGLHENDAVLLALAARPGFEPLEASISRGAGPSHEFVIGAASVSVKVPPGRESGVKIVVTQGEGRPRRAYVLHLREIVVFRQGAWASTRPWLPAILGVVAFAAFRRRDDDWRRAAIRSLIVVTLTVGLLSDPLATVASDGRWRWLCVLTALVGIASFIGDRHGRRLPRVILTLAVGLLVATMAHLPGLNGPEYWRWNWRRLDWAMTFIAVFAAASPLLAARMIHRARRARLVFVLALMSAGVGLSAAAAMAVQPGGIARMHTVIEDATITSYFTDAIGLAPHQNWLASYPQLMPAMEAHSKTKPAGPVMFYVLLARAFGATSVAATIGALLILVGAALAVPAVYGLAREFGESSETAFEAACLMALSPSLILFCPEFDQTFPLLTCILLASWHRAINGSRLAAIVAGLSVFAASFFSYSFFVLGVTAVVLALRNVRGAVRAALYTAAVTVLLYTCLHAFTRFDPISTFQAALANQAVLAAHWARRYLPAVMNDPLDFALGVGWIAAMLAAVTVYRTARSKEWNLSTLVLMPQVVIVNFTGLLRVEAARVWLFMMPLVAIPAGRELAQWSQEERDTAYFLMILLVAAVAQNMTFL